MVDPNQSSGVNDSSGVNQSSTVNESERVQYLASLQAVTTMTMIPAMVFLIVLSVTGLVGNSFVLFVYSQRFTRTSTRVFVLAIAAFDLVANVIGIPGEIFDMFHIWDFNDPPFCRARLFFNAFSTLTSAMILLAMAVTRYRKVCFPYGWQTSIKQARMTSLVITLLGILFSLPYVVLNGHQTKKTPRPDIFGSECTTDDSYVNTVWPLLNNGFFVTLFLVCCIPFTVLYVKIGIQAWRHSVHHGSRGVQSPTSYIATASSAGIARDSTHKGNTPQIRTDNGGTGRRESEPAVNDVSADFGSIAEALGRLVGDGNGLEGSHRCIVGIKGGSVEVSPAQMDEFIVQLKNAANSGDGEALKGIKVIGVSTVRKRSDDRDLCDKVGHRKPSLNGINASGVDHRAGQTTTSDADQGIDTRASEVVPDVGTHGVENMAFVDDSGSLPILFVNPTFNSLETSPNESALQPSFPSSCSVTDSNISHPPTPVITPTSSPRSRHQVIDSEITENQAQRIDSSSRDTVTFNTQTSVSDLDASLPSSRQQNEAEKAQHEETDTTETLAETPSWVDIVICPHAGREINQRQSSAESSESLTEVSLRISSTNAMLQKNEWLRSLVVGFTDAEKSRKEQTPNIDPDPENPKIPAVDERHLSLPDQVAVRQYSNKNDQKASRGSKNVMSRIKSAVLSTRTLHRFSDRPTSGTGRRPLSRTTAMLITISAVYIVGFVPYLILVFYRLIWPDRYSSLTMSEEAAYNLFLRTYFLNCAANPIIYGVCDKNFRRECISLLKCR
ncbi:unnamed protein product [Lymnaea stagnalis]|uniref:G-protein coupled receptors family 1 profile domain-containing protein n=1 Tax=Lymnaea stagnalis TaxID=6523 RepID=A0AAV2IA91_LYMST